MGTGEEKIVDESNSKAQKYNSRSDDTLSPDDVTHAIKVRRFLRAPKNIWLLKL